MESCVESWLGVLDKYYLSDFISSGGAAFKLLLTRTDEETAFSLRGIRELTARLGYLYAEVSAAETRVDKIDQIFFAIARQMDWDALMAEDGMEFLRSRDYRLPEGAILSDTEAIAHFNGCTQEDLSADLRRATTQEIFQDRDMCKEFRTAIAQVRVAQFFPGNITPSDAETICGWLRGDKVGLSALRGLRIYSKIGRHNARHMLRALAHWLAKSSGTGLVVGLDLSALLPIRPRGAGAELTTLYYSRSAFLDVCEVLREFIDDTDEITHCLICAVAPSEMETGEQRSIERYAALKNRLINEVHDRERPNLLAAMVRTGEWAPRERVTEDDK